MPMSSLDPSMLLGFLIQDDSDWQDFCARMNNVRERDDVSGIDMYVLMHECFTTGTAQNFLHTRSATYLE